MKPKLTKENSCQGKVPYNTKTEASTAAALLNVKDGGKKRVVPYACCFCGLFHFGHSKKGNQIKQPSKEKRQKKKLDPDDYDVSIGIDKGFCIITDNRNIA